MKKLVIGIDIGGINTVLGLVDRTGEVLSLIHISEPTRPY